MALGFFGILAVGFIVCWVIALIVLIFVDGYSIALNDIENKETHTAGAVTFGVVVIGGIIAICIGAIALFDREFFMKEVKEVKTD
jgi:uncharacterized integral membrane protein